MTFFPWMGISIFLLTITPSLVQAQESPDPDSLEPVESLEALHEGTKLLLPPPGGYCDSSLRKNVKSPTLSTEWKKYYGGLTRKKSYVGKTTGYKMLLEFKIPQKGMKSYTDLAGYLKGQREIYGTSFTYEGKKFIQGEVSHFGGPHDSTVQKDEVGALNKKKLREMSPNAYYCAMRFDPLGAKIKGDSPGIDAGVLREWTIKERKDFWAHSKLLVVNPLTGAAVVVRPIDIGPNVIRSKGKIIDVSPAATKALGLKPDTKSIAADSDGRVIVSFAPDSAPLGPVAIRKTPVKSPKKRPSSEL